MTVDNEIYKKENIDVSKVKTGDLFTFTKNVKVLNISNDKTTLSLMDLDNGDVLSLEGNKLIESGSSADQYTKTESVSKSDLVKVLNSANGKVFTISFDKEDGSERVLRGRYLHGDLIMGRTYVEDLDIPKDFNRIRLVNNRKINYLIIDGVKLDSK